MLIPPLPSSYTAAQAFDESMKESNFHQTLDEISKEFEDAKVTAISNPDQQLTDITSLISQIQQLNSMTYSDNLHQQLENKCVQLIQYLKEHPSPQVKTSLAKIFDHVSPSIFNKQINLIKAYLSN